MEPTTPETKKSSLNIILAALIIVLIGAVIYLVINPVNSGDKDVVSGPAQEEEIEKNIMGPGSTEPKDSPIVVKEDPTPPLADYKDDIDADINSVDSLDLDGTADEYSEDGLADL